MLDEKGSLGGSSGLNDRATQDAQRRFSTKTSALLGIERGRRVGARLGCQMQPICDYIETRVCMCLEVCAHVVLVVCECVYAFVFLCPLCACVCVDVHPWTC